MNIHAILKKVITKVVELKKLSSHRGPRNSVMLLTAKSVNWGPDYEQCVSIKVKHFSILCIFFIKYYCNTLLIFLVE